MRILLVSANQAAVNMPVFPLGLACLGAALRAEGHGVEALDLLGQVDPRKAIATAIRAFQPQLIGVSVRNIDNQDFYHPESYLPAARRVVRACRRASRVPIVLGGAGFSIFPRAALEFLGGDYGVAGEGERAVCRLARAVEAGQPPAGIGGVIERGRPAPLRRAACCAFDALPAPARELLDVRRYAAAGPMPIQGKRGCHLGCIYCSSPVIEGHTVRLRQPASIAAEMADAQERHGIESFFFVDNLFNYPEEHAVALCREIVKRGLHVRWRAIVNPRFATRRLVRVMALAGCVEASLGFESGSPRMLRRLRKGFSVNDVRRTSRLLREFGIAQTGFLLLGGPGEDRASVDASFALAEALGLEMMKLAVGVRIYPGTAMARLAADEGVIARDADLLEPVFYLSPAVRDWLPERAQREAASHPGWKL